jgi:small redox-active disulfide protein 2
MEIKVLGTGCTKCKKLFEETKAAVAESGVEAAISKVEKIDEITSYGVLMTPALVINGEVKSSGKIPKAAQILEWLKETKK